MIPLIFLYFNYFAQNILLSNCVPVRRSGSSRDWDFWHVSGLLPRWPPTQTSPSCHLCSLLLPWSFYGYWGKNRVQYGDPLLTIWLCLYWPQDMSHTGGAVHLPVVWLLCLQWDDSAFVCHSSVCVCHLDLWSVNRYGEESWLLLVNAEFFTLLLHLLPGADRFYETIEDMIGYKPFPLIKYCLKFITPLVCMVSSTCKYLWFQQPVEEMFISIFFLQSCFQGTFLFSLIKYTPLKFNNTTEYPWWGYALGWWFTLSSTLMVPVFMIFKVIMTPGTLRQVRHRQKFH